MPASRQSPTCVHVLAKSLPVTGDELGEVLTASGAMIRSLHLAIVSAAHPDCPVCRAVLPVLASYLAAEGISPPA